MAGIEIVPVDNLLRFLTFCKLPRLIYKGQKGFAPSLDAERWNLYSHKLNPHFKHVDAQEFLARKDGKWVGRIGAQVYKPEIQPVSTSRWQFGSLDAIDDIEVVRALTQAAEEWLRARGAETIVGPFAPDINGESGMLIDGFEATPMFLMPWHPPYLSRLIEALGYDKAKDLISYRHLSAEQDLSKERRIADRPEWRNRLKIRQLDRDHLKQGETALMSDLFNDAWRGNWGFVPLGKDELDGFADLMKYVMPPEFGIVLEFDGAPVSFAVALPNLHEITADFDGKLLPFNLFKLISRIRKHKFSTARLLLLGTRKTLQNSATGGAILLSLIEDMRRRSCVDASIVALEAGWVLEDNMGMRKPIEMFGGKIDKIHRVYEKRVAGAPPAATEAVREEATP